MMLTRRYACVRTWCSWLPTAHGAGGPSGSLLRQLHGRVSPHLPFIIDDITATTPPPSESPGTLSGRGRRSSSAGAAPSTAVSPTRIGSREFRLCLEMVAREQDFRGDRTVSTTRG